MYVCVCISIQLRLCANIYAHRETHTYNPREEGGKRCRRVRGGMLHAGLYGFLPVGRTDHFTVDVVLRLPVLSSDGFRMVFVHPNSGNRNYAPLGQPRQQLTSVYDPLICTRVKDEGGEGTPRTLGGNQVMHAADISARALLLVLM